MKEHYATDEVARIKSKHRRDERRELKICINAPIDPNSPRSRVVHGPVVPGKTKCQHCLDVQSGRGHS